MACSETKRLANVDCPSFPTTQSGMCCYVVAVKNDVEAADVITDAQNQSDYVKKSRFYSIPNDMIQFYLYFKES